MIKAIIEASIRNRFLVFFITSSLVCAGIWSMFHTKLDAIPDLSDVQVIIQADFPGQNPQVVDDQVTYPLVASMLAVPGSTVVRGFSMFEQSFVYVLFEEGTDIYWARSRVLEYLNFARTRLPKEVEPRLGPDATGVGWVYQYALVPGFYSLDHPKGWWVDEELKQYYSKVEDAPLYRRDVLKRVRALSHQGVDPITGTKLQRANIDLGELRSLQDWYMRYPLSAIDDVSEVASIGGYVKQYQVILEPERLLALKVTVPQIVKSVKMSNNDVGGSVLELGENEYMVRSRGYLKSIDDLEQVVVGVGEKGFPVRLRDVAQVQIGGEARRGAAELNGEGEVAGAVVIARFGSNAYEVIQKVKAKIAELSDGLPLGVYVQATYDRSDLIGRSVRTLRHTLIEELIVVGLVCILFLLHARSELVAVFVVPASVIFTVLAMNIFDINANIMSLGGIAIAIGVVVDSAIIMVENAHKHLDYEEDSVARGESPRARIDVITEAACEVGPQLFFCLLIITVSFLPIFALEGEAGRLFKPLAFTKTFAMASASLLSITIIPVLMYYLITSRVLPKEWGRTRSIIFILSAMLLPGFIALSFLGIEKFTVFNLQWWALGWAVLAGMLLVPQRIIHEEHSPISHFLRYLYEPVFWLCMRNPRKVVFVALLALSSTYYPFSQLGTEFMPPLDEGDLLYMPTTDPSVSITKSKELLQQTDKLIRTFPEVVSVHGKIGRAETATDPAPLSMIESIVQLNSDKNTWRTRPVEYFFSSWPAWLKLPFTKSFWPETRAISVEELKFGWTNPDGTYHAGLNDVVRLPGLANAWPFPIANRLTMLSTGIKTPVGIKILGPDLEEIGRLAMQASEIVRPIKGTISSYAERTTGGFYLDVDINREEAARYGLRSGEIQETIQTAVGGMNISTTVEGLERYPINVRYARELRDNLPALEHVLVSNEMGLQVPLGQVAHLQIKSGAPMIRSENAERTAWVYVDVAGRDIGSYVAEARSAISKQLKLPVGYTLIFSGQFEAWEKTLPRLIAVTALTLVVILLLLYFSSRSWFRVSVIMLAVPFSMIGAIWALYAAQYNFSLAVMVGMIALAGLDAETGMVMLLYLENSLERFKRQGKLASRSDLISAIHDGAVLRIRPKAMTVAAAFVGLMPILWADGSGADVMRRLGVPMLGGLFISFVMELVVYPVVFYLAHRRVAYSENV